VSWFGGATKQRERVTAAAHLDFLLCALGLHDAAKCDWKGGTCGAFQATGPVRVEYKQNPYDEHQYMALFDREPQGVVGQWFFRVWAGQPEPGTIWHLVTVQQGHLLDNSSKEPVVKWSPNFKQPEAFQLWSERNRELQFLSNYESGTEPFAQLELFR
jgi:hypothetical protein